MINTKPGAYLRMSVPCTGRYNGEDDDENSSGASVFGCSSTEEYAKRDASGDVIAGKSDRVLIVKVIACVRRSATVEE